MSWTKKSQSDLEDRAARVSATLSALRYRHGVNKERLAALADSLNQARGNHEISTLLFIAKSLLQSMLKTAEPVRIEQDDRPWWHIGGSSCSRRQPAEDGLLRPSVAEIQYAISECDGHNRWSRCSAAFKA